METEQLADDPHDLMRFIEAQADSYSDAIEELRSGWKRTHWMWFIFPQYIGLGESNMSEWYAIKSLEEARAYLLHPILGQRLRACSETV